MEMDIRVEHLEHTVSTSSIEETVSVVIPTRNAGPGFRDLLDAIRKQRKVKNVEILVLDSDSTDNTVALAHEFDARVIPIEPARFSHGGTRNRAAEEASGNFLVFTVQDAVPLNPYWLFKLVSPMVTDPELKAVSTRQVPPPQGRISLYAGWTLEDLDLNIYTPLGGRDISIQAPAQLEDKDIPTDKRRLFSFFDNVCSCIRKDYFLDNRFSVLVNAEDMDFGYRLLKSGNKFGFIHSTAVVHYHDRGPQHILKLNYLAVLAQQDILEIEPPFFLRLNGIQLADLDVFFSDYLAMLSHVLKDLNDGKEWLLNYSNLVMRTNGNGQSPSMAQLAGPIAEDFKDLQSGLSCCLLDSGEEPQTDRQQTLWMSSLPFHRPLLSWLQNSVDAKREEIGRALVCLTARFFGYHIAGFYLSHHATDPDLCAQLNDSLEIGICRSVPLGSRQEADHPLEPEALTDDDEAIHEHPMDGERFLPWMGDPRISYEHLHRYHFSRRFARGKTLLDLGSGEGYGANFLAEVARSVTAIDIDQNAVTHARARYRRDNLEYFHNDARVGSVLQDNSFDMVVCFEVLGHVQEQNAFLATIARVLQEDGLAIISTPNKDVSNHHNEFHARELNLEEFQALIKRHFPHARFYNQLDLAGSAIAPLEGGGELEMKTVSRENGEYRFSENKRINHEYLIALVSHQPTALQHVPINSFCIDYSKSIDHYYMDQINAFRAQNDTQSLKYVHEASTLEIQMDEALLLSLNTHEMVYQMLEYWTKIHRGKRSKGITLSPEDLTGMKKVFHRLDTVFHALSTLLNPKQKQIADTR